MMKMTAGTAERPPAERPTFFELLVPLVALALGAVLATAFAVGVLFALLSILV